MCYMVTKALGFDFTEKFLSDKKQHKGSIYGIVNISMMLKPCSLQAIAWWC